MSTEVEVQPISTQNKTDDATDTEDQSATQPIILQFLQEASKLAAPSHRSLVDSTFDRVTSDRKNAYTSNNCSDTYSKQSWAQTFSYNGSESSDMYMITTHIGPDLKGSNPWEVMTLINLQCEKLLHHRGQGESDCASFSSSSSSDSNSITYPSLSELDESSRGGGSLGCSSRDVGGGERSGVKDTPSDLGERSDESLNTSLSQQCTTKAEDGSLTESQPANDGRPFPVDESTDLSSQPAHSVAMEVHLSVVTGSERDVSGSKERSVLAELGFRSRTSSVEVRPQTHLSPSTHDSLGYAVQPPSHDPDKVVCVAHDCFNAVDLRTAETAVALDFNSNLLLTFDPLSDAHTFPSRPREPLWAVLSNEELSQNQSQTVCKTTEPECLIDHLDHNAMGPSVTQQSYLTLTRDLPHPLPQQCMTSSQAGRRSLAENTIFSSAEDCRTPVGPRLCRSASSACRASSRRKQSHPTRSADAEDPDFQGVMFRMQGQLDHSRGQCRLLIYSKYRIPSSHRRKPRRRTRSSQSSIRTSSSDEDPDPSPSGSRSKECASCCTKKTPMWRDAEDGTPLCNACGIRYKKYKVRCLHCWFIPRKDGNTHSRCLKCGNSVRPASAPRKQTAC